MKLSCLYAGSVFFASVLFASSEAATLNVPEDFATITAAISAAVSGDTISVAPGVYKEQIDFGGKSIKVVSRGLVFQTVIDGSPAVGFVVRADKGEGVSAELSGFTITGGTPSGPTQGGGMRINSKIRVSNCLFVGNRGVDGGGVQVAGGSPVIEDSVFVGNVSTVRGGGLATALKSQATLTNLLFESNRSQDGGGLSLFGNTSVRDVTLQLNVSTQFGGAIYLGQGNHELVGLTVSGNGRRTQTGLNSWQYDPIGGGGLYTVNASGRLLNSTFTGNAGALGGGLYIAGNQGNLLVANVVMNENQSTRGGGIYLNDSKPSIINCSIVRNETGLYTTSAARPNVTNCLISSNRVGILQNVDVYGAGLAQVQYSWTGDPILNGATIGAGVRSGDPKVNLDASPRRGSPLIDAGDTDALPADIVRDLAGVSRRIDDRFTPNTGVGFPPIDIGAYEYVPASGGHAIVP